MAAASTFGLDGFVRVCGDSPLLDQRLVDRGAGIFRSGAYDLVTNVFPRTFPPGQSVEVMSTAFFRRGYALMSEAGDLEHVTRFFYRHNHRFNILNFSAPEDYSGLHLAVDTAEDMQRFAGLVASMARPHWHYGLPEIVRLYRQVETNNEDGQEK
jgi:spore coat polysaccharide biosynthesis protein SpsF